MLSQLDRDWILFRIRRLSGAQFEDLCRDLLNAEGHQDIQHFGAAGSEKGVDILSRTPDGRWLVTQCKQVASLGPKPAGEELQKVIDHPLDPPLQAFRIAAPINYTRATREKLQEIGGQALEIEPAWDGPVLLDLLEKHRDIRDDRIGFIPSKAEIQKTLPFWNVPRRNDYFTGREELLDELERRLESEGSTALTQTITGLGGIGKTQIAIEYCHRQRSAFDGGVFWLDASSAESLLAGYGQLAVDLGNVGREVPVEDAARAFLQNLAQSNGWLVVLDNADEPATIRRLLPPTTDGQVLITTRAQTPGLGKSKPLPVDILPIDQATEFLLERSGRDENEQQAAEELARALDGLPLALEQAGAFLAQNEDLDFADYVEEFQTKKFELFDSPQEGSYQETVATTWQINFQKVQQTSQAAAEALDVCAFLAPDAIPIELFTNAGALLGPGLEALAKENSRTAISSQLIKPLTSYSLAKFETENRELAMHRLVQQVIRQRLRKEERATQICEAINRALDFSFPKDPRDPTAWEDAFRWIPHIQENRRGWPGESKVDPAALWLRAGYLAGAAGRSSEAWILEKAAFQVRKRVLGEEHPLTLISMNNLAETLQDLGELKEAKELLEAALLMSHRVLGEEHPVTLSFMSNLGVTLSLLGEPQEARSIQEIALQVRRRTLGDEHPDTLTSMNNLAETLRALGEIQEARTMNLAALEVSKRILGKEHPDTLASMNNFAETLRVLGETQEARSTQETVLEVSNRILGKEHPSTLASMNNLAETLRTLGKAQESRSTHEATLEVRRRILGKEHPDTLTSMNNFAETLRQLGKSQEAQSIHEAALEIRRRILGKEHPITLTSMNNYAESLRELGEIQESRSIHEATLEVRRRILGEEHSDTLISMSNLARILWAFGEANNAQALLEAALKVSQRTLGEEHPDTLISIHNLCTFQVQADGMDVDSGLVQKLLEGVSKLPPGTPIRKAAEARWLPKPDDSD